MANFTLRRDRRCKSQRKRREKEEEKEEEKEKRKNNKNKCRFTGINHFYCSTNN